MRKVCKLQTSEEEVECVCICTCKDSERVKCKDCICSWDCSLKCLENSNRKWNEASVQVHLLLLNVIRHKIKIENKSINKFKFSFGFLIEI